MSDIYYMVHKEKDYTDLLVPLELYKGKKEGK